MPRRNLTAMMLVAILSIACFAQVDHGLYAARLRQVMTLIHDKGLEKTNRRELFEAAAKAMADTVDENTEFYTAQQKEEVNQDLNQEFGGIGAVLMSHKKRPQIRHVLHNQPAAKAGLLPGDIVFAVDGIDTLNFKMLGDFVRKVKGRPGTEVKLTVERRGADAPLDVTVVRDVIEVESVKGYVRRADGTWDYLIPGSPRIAYIRIEDKFGAKAYDELTAALKSVHEQKFAGLVLDLRNNRGGLLDAAEKICNLFLPADKVILTTRDREKKIRANFRSDGSGPYQDIPLAVLINKHSASASEIVAGCLKDNGRAITVGERTFGKGTVQQLFDVDAGRSTLKLTTASFWTPSERQIHRSPANGGKDRDGADESFDWGILPSEGYEVVLDDDGIDALTRHFDKLDFAAIDGTDGLDFAKPEEDDSKSDAEPPKNEDSAGDPEDSGADQNDVSDENNAADAKEPEKMGPFVDIQLRRAVQGIEKLIQRGAHGRAA